MLKRLELTFFRKHEHLVVDFVEGLHTFRGSNEAGKSTIIEAMLYAMFGSRTLRTPLSETVTWGHAENELKVSMQFGDMVFNRHSRGAEVLRDGKVFVTGQNEVTAFAATMIGADAATAARLMLANQGNLRGSLEAGPKATAEMIEGLADFDLFDRIIEAMQNKLLLGAPASFERIVEESEERLASMIKPTKPCRGDLDKRLAENQRQAEKAVSDKASASAAVSAAQEAYDTVRAQAAEVIRTLQDIERVEAALANHKAERAKSEAQSTGPSPHVIEGLRQAVTDANNAATAMSAWQAFNAFVPGATWEGSKASYDDEVARVDREIEISRVAITECAHTIQAEEHRLNAGDTCTTCGQKLPNSEAIQTLRVRAEQVIGTVKQELAGHTTTLEGLRAYRTQLGDVHTHSGDVTKLLVRCGAYVDISDATYPPTVSWKGSAPTNSVSITDAKRDLAAAESAHLAAIQAAARVTAMDEAIAADQVQLDALRSKELPDINEDIVGEAEKILSQARVRLQAADLEISTLQTMRRLEEAGFKEAEQAYERAMLVYTELTQQLERAKADLASLNFNNALLKKIRAARPIIADKLWAMVLAAVSTMFTTMRGEKSVVVKGKDGFTVNGQAVASLSGSTLDLLGLAIRIALVKTFLPTCPFLILDEPAAAMDTGRTAQMLGFIASAGFTQVILVTHEDVSEVMADHVIQL